MDAPGTGGEERDADTPAAFSTSDTRGPDHSAFPTAPRDHWIPGTFGENSALPHHESSDREIGPGEILLIDMGAIADGYCSDCTRTVATGELDGDAREVYEVVRSAQARALEAIRAGVSGVDADAVARDEIIAAGYGDEFGHGLGHGVGIAVHEGPRLSKRSEETLEPGDVVTVEPGIYLPGRFGVRIEDLVTVTENGCRNLSGVPKELRAIG